MRWLPRRSSIRMAVLAVVTVAQQDARTAWTMKYKREHTMAVVLLVPANSLASAAWQQQLTARGPHVAVVNTPAELIAVARKQTPSLVLVHASRADALGSCVLDAIHLAAPDVPLLVLGEDSPGGHFLLEAVLEGAASGGLRQPCMESFPQLAELLPEAIMVHDMDGIIRFWNASAEGVFGYCGKEMVGRHFGTLLAEDQRDAVVEMVTERLAHGPLGPLGRHLGRARRKSGEIIPVEISVACCVLSGKRACVSVTRDITQRKLAEDELRQTREMLEQRVHERTLALQQVNAALEQQIGERRKAEASVVNAYVELAQIFRTAAGGLRVIDRNFTVLRANETLARMTGIPVAEMTGSRCHESFPGPDCHTPRCPLTRCSRGERIHDLEVEKRTRHGAVLPCLLNAQVLTDAQNNVIGIVEDYRDLTETKRLQSIAEAVNTMQNIGYVFSGIRHELGNPVNALKTTLTVLKRRFDSFSAEAVQEYIDRSLADVSRMEYILKGLRSFSMHESLILEPVSMQAFMGTLVPLVQRDLNAKGIRFVRDLVEDVWVMADARALQQVMLNLITNAVDALQGRANPVVSMRVHAKGPLTLVETLDNGCGMEEGQVRDLFKPFFTTKPNGTGLGLVIVKKMVAHMHGTVEVRSLRNQGTTVSILLPRCVAHGGVEHAHPAAGG